MNLTNIKRITVVIALTFIAMADVHAQLCPTVSSNTTVTSSCNTGITWTGGNLTIGDSEGESVSVSSSGAAISGSGALGSLENTSTGSISTTGNGAAINNLTSGSITTLNNSGEVNALNGVGINNNGTIKTLNNYIAGSINTTAPGAAGISNGGTIDALNNFGEMTDVGNGFGIDNRGFIDALNNSGSIASSGVNTVGVSNSVGGRITALINSGTISFGGLAGWGIDNYGTITTLTNSGTISAGMSGYGINNGGTITTLTNSGTISAGADGYGIYNIFNGIGMVTLSNAGTISVGADGVGIYSAGAITALNNAGMISAGANGIGIRNEMNSNITALTNSGTISAGAGGTGIHNFTGALIETLTNFGTIEVGVGGIGILNIGTIGTLNNAQGGTGATPLRFAFDLPTKYNIIINSASHYGQLTQGAAGSPPITNFGIYGAPFITSRTYTSVLSGTTLPTGTSSGAYDNMTWALVETGVGAEIFNLTFNGVSLMGTQQSLVNTAAALQNTYALQNAVLANSLSYDCPVFGAHNVCVSAGGRNTAVSNANGLNNTSALLIAAYRIKPTLRIGAYADQNLSVNNAGSTVNLGNSTPLIGLFGVWNQRIDGTGTEVKVAAAYGQKNTTVNRQIVGLSEAGTGSSNLNSQGAQITAKYGFAVAPDVLVSPYVGMRYTQNNMGGYTEGASSTVTAPLTYSALNTNATTALAGVGAAYRFIPKATAFASVGVETDTNTSNGTYSATGITGLTPVNFNSNPVKTRPTATLGAYYDIVKNQRIGITGIYRQESYQAISTTTVMATYTIGL